MVESMTREQKQLRAALALPDIQRLVTAAMTVVNAYNGHAAIGPRGAALHALGSALDALDEALPEVPT